MSASPQVEDGHIKIANELYDAVLKFPFTARQLKVVMAIIRKTYGFNKKRDDVSASQLGDMCGMARSHVTNTLNELARKNVISKVKGEYGSMVEITKDYTRWTSTDSVHPPYQNGACTESVLADAKSLNLHDGCTDLVRVYQNGTSTESVQVDSTESVHTKDNLPKDSKPRRQRISTDTDLNTDTDTDFEEAWRLYPKRDGDNPKAKARKAWNARIREGISAASMIEGVRAYARQVQDAGNVGSRYVKMTATFLGPDHHFAAGTAADASAIPAAGASWWQRAGFAKEWQATNAGCDERYAHLWRDGERVRSEEPA